MKVPIAFESIKTCIIMQLSPYFQVIWFIHLRFVCGVVTHKKKKKKNIYIYIGKKEYKRAKAAKRQANKKKLGDGRDIENDSVLLGLYMHIYPTRIALK